MPDSADTILRQEIGFYRVQAQAQLALLGGGDPKEAEAAMKAFLGKERTTFHFFEIAEIFGHLAIAAETTRMRLATTNNWPRHPGRTMRLRSDVLLGGVLQAQSKWDEAIAQYDRALAGNATDPTAVRQQTFARIGKAACQAEQGQATAAIRDLQEVIAKNDPSDDPLFAQAYLAHGLGVSSARSSRWTPSWRTCTWICCFTGNGRPMPKPCIT